MALYAPGRGFSPDTESVAALILDISTYSSVRNQCLMLISHLVFGIFVIAAQIDVRQAHKDFSLYLEEKKKKSSCLVSLLTRTLIPSEQGPTLVTSLNLNALGSVSKYNHTVDWSLPV